MNAKAKSLWGDQLEALVHKEFAQIARDPSSYLVALVLPALFLFIFGYGIKLDPDNLRLGLVDESATQASRALVADFKASPWFDATEFASAEEAATAMRESRVQGFLRIRENHERELAKTAAAMAATSSTLKLSEQTRTPDEAATIQLVVDGTEPNSASFLQGYASRLLAVHAQGLAEERHLSLPSINVVDRYWYNPTARSVNFLVPGAITVIMTLIGTLLTSLVFSREWERGTMEAMLATPVTRAQLVLGKLIPYFLLGMFSLLLCAFLAILVFGIPFRGSFVALILVSSVFLVCALGQGLLISVRVKGQLVAAEAGLFSGFLPSLLLSGFVFDIHSMPPVLQWLAQILPATHYNLCIRSLFLAGTIPEVLVPRTLCLTVLATLFMVLVYKGLKKSVE